jgi:polyferredoxin
MVNMAGTRKHNNMKNKILPAVRRVLAAFALIALTLVFLDFTGLFQKWLGFLAKIQFLPAVLAANFAVIVVLLVITLLFGRVYCSALCPLGVFQDGVSWLSGLRKKGKKRLRFGFSKEKKWLRYTILALFVLAMIFGVQIFVALLAPYSAYGRIVTNLFQPVYRVVNNLFAGLSEHFGNYAFYPKSVWLKSLPTFIVAAVTFIAVVVMSWKNGRSYCNTVCPIGTLLSLFSRFAMFRPVIDTDKCKNCMLCEHACKASCIDVANHKIDYSRCVACFNCLENCHCDALHYKFTWRAPLKQQPKPTAGALRAESVSVANSASSGTNVSPFTSASKSKNVSSAKNASATKVSLTENASPATNISAATGTTSVSGAKSTSPDINISPFTSASKTENISGNKSVSGVETSALPTKIVSAKNPSNKAAGKDEQAGKGEPGNKVETAGMDKTTGKEEPAGKDEPMDKGRRAFLTSTALLAGAVSIKAQEKKIDGGLALLIDKKEPERTKRVVPFGAVSLKNIYEHCTACGLCIAACPNEVLRPSSDLKHLMMPYMSFEKGYCRPECTKCSQVCPTGAILPITPEEKTAIHIGIASVDYELCVVNTDGVNCGNCARHCPAAAIHMVAKDPGDTGSLKIPSVDTELCIGCGACENLCPAAPYSAIRVNGREIHIDNR